MSWFTVVRYATFAGVALCTAVAVGDWALRTKRLSPFSRLGRWTRRASDRLITPIEHRLVSFGQNPVQAGWWLTVGALVSGVVLLSFIPWLVATGLGASRLVQQGPRGMYVLVVSTTYRILVLALILRVVVSWLGLNPYARWMRPVRTLTEWMLRPLRRHVPPLGMLDVTPLVAWFGLWIASRMLLGLA